MTAADRYLRTGTEVPQVYPGTLEHMVAAGKDTRRASAAQPGDHSLFAIYGSEWHLLRVYEDGELTWMYRAGEG